MKRGQVTIYVILGIVIIFIVGFILFLTNSFNYGSLNNPRVEDVEDFMESCIKDIISTSTASKLFTGSADDAEIFLAGYIKEKIRSSCEKGIDDNFNNVEKPTEVFVEVDIVEIDYTSVGSNDASKYIDPVTGEETGLHIYERATAKVTYAAKLNVGGDKFTLKPIFVEYSFK